MSDSPGIGGFLNPTLSSDEVTIKIDNKEIFGFTTNTIQRSMKAIADGFSFSVPYDPNEEDSRLFDPYTWKDCDLYINDTLYVKGVSTKWSPQSSNNRTEMKIESRSLSGSLLECPLIDGRLNYRRQRLSQIVETVLAPFNLTAEFPNGDSQILYNVKRKRTENIGEFLQKLAKDNGFIISTPKIVTTPPSILESVLPSSLIETQAVQRSSADLVFKRANINGEPILNLNLGEQPILNAKADYDGSKRFSDFQASSQIKGRNNNFVIVDDQSVLLYRPKIFDAKNLQRGALETTAKWVRSRSLAEAAPVRVTVDGWRDKNNNTIQEDEIVTLFYPKICIFQETRFLIESVNLVQGNDGKTAELTLVLPQAYTLEYPSPGQFAWDRPERSLLDRILGVFN
jgi:prophage tail gpP-like protein